MREVVIASYKNIAATAQSAQVLSLSLSLNSSCFSLPFHYILTLSIKTIYGRLLHVCHQFSPFASSSAHVFYNISFYGY
jgi:hypothetical protein